MPGSRPEPSGDPGRSRGPPRFRSWEQFTSIAAHDLREPLRKLVTFSDLLRQDLGDDLPAQANEDLEYIVDAAERMDRLVASLLELSRAGSGQLGRERVDLEGCARRALEVLSPRVAETNARIELDPLPAVQGDEALLTQVFQNLIGNALKFTRSDRPNVRITRRVESGETVLGVRDDGIGMDPKHAEEVFAPFKRLHGRQAFEGTGIGLAIARKVVERHGGRIWVESAPGEGAHFRFTLAGLGESVDAPCAA